MNEATQHSKNLLLDGKSGPWEMVIGIEVHAQISSRSKLFSSAATNFGGAPNSQVSNIDAAFPGMLPVINKECVRQAIRTGLALEAVINPVSVFARKNYFYPDLPQGYQISQFDQPIVGNGHVMIDLEARGEAISEDTQKRKIRIERLHLEQDAGKSLHDQHPDLSFIDLNRAGVALMEIVSFPDIRSADEAAAYVGKLRTILRHIGASDGNMAEGSMRADINLSLRRPGGELGTRTEVKNVNSLRFIRQAVETEARRQMQILDDGGTIHQETRLYDPAKGETRSMRSKEDAHDYRYFPDPDLLPLILSEEEIEDARKSLPELPDQMKDRLVADHGLQAYDASVIVSERETADYFTAALATGANPRTLASWLTVELFGRLTKSGTNLAECKVSPKQLGQLVSLIESGDISGKMAKDIFDDMVETGNDPAQIIDQRGLRQMNDETELSTIIDKIMTDNAEQVEKYRSGKTGLKGWFVGQVMKETRGQANPAAVNRLLEERLNES